MDCHSKALDLLARREHSCKELQLKLAKRGYGHEEIQLVVQALQQSNLQSDERFSQSYVRYRAGQGFGPNRIRQELSARHVSQSLIESSLYEQEIDWIEQARMAKWKKFGSKIPEEFEEKIKQLKFLQYRGFESGQLPEIMGD